MHTLLVILQVILSIVLLVLIAVTEDKNEQGGGIMGLGAAGGRSSGEVDMVVGAERILQPALRWVSGGFLATSVVAAYPASQITIWHIAITAVIYVVVMFYGGIAWEVITGTRQKVK